jgi:hypothetical protein
MQTELKRGSGNQPAVDDKDKGSDKMLYLWMYWGGMAAGTVLLAAAVCLFFHCRIPALVSSFGERMRLKRSAYQPDEEAARPKLRKDIQEFALGQAVFITAATEFIPLGRERI